jgi:hypothetical protein
MIKESNEYFRLTIPRKILADINALGYETHRDISHFILMAVSEKLERGQKTEASDIDDSPLAVRLRNTPWSN